MTRCEWVCVSYGGGVTVCLVPVAAMVMVVMVVLAYRNTGGVI